MKVNWGKGTFFTLEFGPCGRLTQGASCPVSCPRSAHSSQVGLQPRADPVTPLLQPDVVRSSTRSGTRSDLSSTEQLQASPFPRPSPDSLPTAYVQPSVFMFSSPAFAHTNSSTIEALPCLRPTYLSRTSLNTTSSIPLTPQKQLLYLSSPQQLPRTHVSFSV